MNNKNVIIGFVLFLAIVFTIGYFKNKVLNEYGVRSVCKIIEIKNVGSGMRTFDSKAVYYSYQVDGKEYISQATQKELK